MRATAIITFSQVFFWILAPGVLPVHAQQGECEWVGEHQRVDTYDTAFKHVKGLALFAGTSNPRPYCRSFEADKQTVAKAILTILPKLGNRVTVSDVASGEFATDFLERRHLMARWVDRYTISLIEEKPGTATVRVLRVVQEASPGRTSGFRQVQSDGHNETWILTQIAEGILTLARRAKTVERSEPSASELGEGGTTGGAGPEQKTAQVAPRKEGRVLSAGGGQKSPPVTFELRDGQGNRIDSSRCNTPNRYVGGRAPREVDIRDTETAHAYLLEGIRFFHKQCRWYLDRAVLYPKGRIPPGAAGFEVAVYLENEQGDIEAEVTYSVYRNEDPDPDKRYQYTGWGYRNRAYERGLPRQAEYDLIRQAEGQAGASAHFRTRSSRTNYCDPPDFDIAFDVLVDVPDKIDLTNDRLAKAYTSAGLGYAFSKCDKLSYTAQYYGYRWRVSVYLYQGANGEKVVGVWARNSGVDRDAGLKQYRNIVLEQKTARVKAQQEAEKREAKLRPVRERLNAFLTRYKVERFVSCSGLETNPYAFEQKVVAMAGRFDLMIAADKAIIAFGELGGCGVVVSSVPRGTFPAQRVEVLVAGRVIGQLEVRGLQLPHVRFVGLHICQETKCKDILPGE